MRRTIILILVGIALISCKTTPVRPPGVAGEFYPADTAVLSNTVDNLLAQAVLPPDPAGGRLLTILAPHASLEYSGWVAAYSYKKLSEFRDIDTVILLGPSHYGKFQGASVYAEGKFQTPLGDIPINEGLAESFINPEEDVIFFPGAYDHEHSLEVQLPFLQRVLPEFSMVPILVSGRPTREMYNRLVYGITEELAGNPRAILVVTSDLSHYHEYTVAETMDGKMVDALRRMSSMDMESLNMSGAAEVDAPYPLMIMMEVARRLGGNRTTLFKYGNSGDVLPTRDSVVGYASMGYFRSPFTAGEKKELLDLARQAIADRVTQGRITQYETRNPKFLTDGAVFVTIDIGGQLRGCIGQIRPSMPLYQSVIRNAQAASSSDKRFIPMRPDELSRMELEISVISPLRPINSPEEIRIGKDGVYLVVEQATAVFLPSVAVEFRWNRERLMEELAKKAGLEPDAWRYGQIFVFEAEVFAEEPAR